MMLLATRIEIVRLSGVSIERLKCIEAQKHRTLVITDSMSLFQLALTHRDGIPSQAAPDHIRGVMIKRSVYPAKHDSGKFTSTY